MVGNCFFVGARHCALNGRDVEGSFGNSTMFVGETGHRIDFHAGDENGYFLIKASWAAFVYKCFMNDCELTELTEIPLTAGTAAALYNISLAETVDYMRQSPTVAWHLVCTTRLIDQESNIVHR